MGDSYIYKDFLYICKGGPLGNFATLTRLLKEFVSTFVS